MPGSFRSYFLLAFDLDDKDQPIAAFPPRLAEDESDALRQAEALASRHAGALAWKREADPVVGEESEPVVIFQSGRIGDYN